MDCLFLFCFLSCWEEVRGGESIESVPVVRDVGMVVE